MSKKTNTLLFMLGATVFNILVVIVTFIVLILVYAKFVMPRLPNSESAASWGLPVIFIASIAASFVLYRVVIKQIIKRIDMEKYFDPLFSRKPRKLF
ncbi:MAG: leader peptide processing enzyme [Treponema sp.]|jgi:hypothetical protein|nr:leader peptide processing enzyme [Treponema sp.]